MFGHCSFVLVLALRLPGVPIKVTQLGGIPGFPTVFSYFVTHFHLLMETWKLLPVSVGHDFIDRNGWNLRKPAE